MKLLISWLLSCRRCVQIIHKLICYQKKCRIRLHYTWRELWSGGSSSGSPLVLLSVVRWVLLWFSSGQVGPGLSSSVWVGSQTWRASLSDPWSPRALTGATLHVLHSSFTVTGSAVVRLLLWKSRRWRCAQRLVLCLSAGITANYEALSHEGRGV